MPIYTNPIYPISDLLHMADKSSGWYPGKYLGMKVPDSKTTPTEEELVLQSETGDVDDEQSNVTLEKTSARSRSIFGWKQESSDGALVASIWSVFFSCHLINYKRRFLLRPRL